MKNPLILSLAISIQSSAAYAECKYLLMALENETKHYKEFEAQELSVLGTLSGTEQRCRQAGTEASMKLATLTQGESCQVLAEISEMNHKLTLLGETCTDTFHKTDEIQKGIENKFSEVFADLEDAYEFMRESEILQQECSREIQAIGKLYTGFREMGPQVGAISGRTEVSTSSYGDFTKVTAAFHHLAGARGERCGLVPDANAPLVMAKAAAGGLLSLEVPKGRHPKPESQITGRIGEISLSSQPNSSKISAPAAVRIEEGPSREGGTARVASLEVIPELGRLPATPSAGGNKQSDSHRSIGAVVWSESDVSGTGTLVILPQPARGPEAQAPFSNAEAEQAEMNVVSKSVSVASASASEGAAAPAADSPLQAPSSGTEVRYLGELAVAAANESEGELSIFARVQRTYRNTEIYRRQAEVRVSLSH